MQGPFRSIDAYVKRCHPGYSPIPGYGANKHGYVMKTNGVATEGTRGTGGYYYTSITCTHKTKPNMSFNQRVSQLVAAAWKLKRKSKKCTDLHHIKSVADGGTNAVRMQRLLMVRTFCCHRPLYICVCMLQQKY